MIQDMMAAADMQCLLRTRWSVQVILQEAKASQSYTSPDNPGWYVESVLPRQVLASQYAINMIAI